MKEIGSFIELQFQKGCEYYSDMKYDCRVARLNSGRAAIYHAIRCFDVSKVYLPYYQCDTVREFLKKKDIEITYYHIDRNFQPMLDDVESNAAVVLVNYYGIMNYKRMKRIAKRYKNVVIDNAQAFFAPPVSDCMNVYSARKFVGVPDGAYVVGKNAGIFMDEYEQGYSSDTASFLLERIEYGCEGKTYQNRMKNEQRLDEEDILKMSPLTHRILDGTDYDFIRKKRKENFNYARKLFDKINQISVKDFIDKDVVPMVYPLVTEKPELMEHLLKNKHFQGHWWSYLLDELDKNTFECYLSKYIVPITIDQRYDQKDIEHIYALVCEEMGL